MDFGELLHFAKKKNDAATKDNEGKFYSTKYSPPKKETNKSKQLSVNIQKFLKKREAEEAERKREERQKLAELMAQRDEKSKNKIRKMLKVTKSANKSVLDDAKDIDVMEAECGPDGQPGDGDDYGYVSNEANAFYQKYIEKVRNVQEDKGFAPSRPQSLRDLSGTKERVKAAINREREDAKNGQRTRTSAASSSSSSAGGSKTSKDAQVARSYSTSKTLYDPDSERRDQERKKLEEEQQRKAKIKRQPQPPPMDFQALLRLAEKKQHEPVVFAQPEKKKEPERLLSAREKREQEERQRQKEQRAQRDRQRESDAKTKDQQPAAASKMVNGRIPKLSTATSKPSSSASDPKAKPTSTAPASSSSSSAKTNLATSTKTNSSSKATVNLNKPAPSASSSSSVSKPKNPYAKSSESGSSTREFPPRDRPTNLMPNKTRQFPPPDVRGGRNPMPSSSSSSVRKPQQEQNRNKRRIYDDDDSEYDSELDDFIDDGDCEEDISSHIRDIFGYDKRRYRDMDDDDRQMESSFAQMQREEFISKKLGLQEDLEDMRMEAMHKKRKMAKKKTKRLDDDDD